MVGVPDPCAVFDTNSIYPDLEALEKDIDAISNEVKDIKIDWKTYPESLLTKNRNALKDKWTMIPLIVNGQRVEKNLSLVPKISSLVSDIKGVESVLINKLSSNSSVEPYYGWAESSDNFLRNNLLLTKNKKDTCSITVGKETKPYVYGKWITYDNSLEHSETNKDSEDRIVLIIDMERPDSITPGESPISFKEGPQSTSK